MRQIALTPAQVEALQKARESASRCSTFASKAQALGLPVLAEFLREAVHILQAGVDQQERAFRANALQQPEQKVIDKDTQADVIADTIKRRGLL